MTQPRSQDHESHDHESHDHESHDHESHDHEAHDHEAHDRAVQDRSDQPVDDRFPDGPEGYPYASPEAESRIKLVTSLLSVVAVGMLLVGLYMALFTTAIGLGSLVAFVGFIDLMLVPFLAKRMRRAALAREGDAATGPLAR